jgi:hypothetical protein
MSEEEPTPPHKPTVEEMMAENLALTKEMHVMMRKVRRYMAVRAVMGVIYLILIVGPIILAAIYLPPLISPVIEQYQSLFGVTGGGGVPSGIDLNEILQLLQSQGS